MDLRTEEENPLDKMSMDRNQWSWRVWEWSTKTASEAPLRLTGLVGEILWDRIPENCKGLDLTRMKITDVSRVPSHIRNLTFGWNNEMTTLPDMSGLPNLRSVKVINCTQLQTLGGLPPALKRLELYNCPRVREIPRLPPTLEQLEACYCISLESIAPLPESLKAVYLTGSGGTCPLPFLPMRAVCVTANTHFSRDPLCPTWETPLWGRQLLQQSFWDEARDMTDKIRQYQLARRTMEVIKEDLMTAAWHPRRVERWLSHGEEVLDMMMGC